MQNSSCIEKFVFQSCLEASWKRYTNANMQLFLQNVRFQNFCTYLSSRHRRLFVSKIALQNHSTKIIVSKKNCFHEWDRIESWGTVHLFFRDLKAVIWAFFRERRLILIWFTCMRRRDNVRECERRLIYMCVHIYMSIIHIVDYNLLVV